MVTAGRRPQRVERIWPVVVTADMLQNDLLWQEIKGRLPEGLGRARVQHLTLLDLPDVELLGALVEQGFGLSDLLARKAASPYAEMDLRRFVYDSADIPYKVRLATVEERWIQTWCGSRSFSASTRTRRRSGGTPRSRRPASRDAPAATVRVGAQAEPRLGESPRNEIPSGSS